jgi:hypothetical protein
MTDALRACSPEDPSELQQLKQAALELSKRSADLFYQGITSEVTAMCCVGTLIIAGCYDGTVGLIDTQIPSLKAKLVKFTLRHEGPVRCCLAQQSPVLQRSQGPYTCPADY